MDGFFYPAGFLMPQHPLLQTVLGQEIAEQPAILRAIMEKSCLLQATQIPSQHVKTLLGLAEGSSYHALAMATPFLEAWTGRPLKIGHPDNLNHWLDVLSDSPPIGDTAIKQPYCLAVSQSGHTASVLSVLQRYSLLAKSLGLTAPAILPVTNYPDQILGQYYGPALDITAGPEQSIAATKTLSATLLTLLRWGLGVGQHLNNLSEAQVQAINAILTDLPTAIMPLFQTTFISHIETVCKSISCTTRLPNTSNTIQDAGKYLILLSKGLLSLTLAEAALKLTETSRSLVFADNTESFKHGPKVILGGHQQLKPITIYVIPSNPVDAKGVYDDCQSHFWGKQNPATSPPQFNHQSVFWVRFQDSLTLPPILANAFSQHATQTITIPIAGKLHPITAMFAVLVTFQWISAMFAYQRGITPDDPALTKFVG
jgi:glucosamine 6-phosphate synthetase-like amidotransferase/phosphosugar isomerase protein